MKSQARIGSGHNRSSTNRAFRLLLLLAWGLGVAIPASAGPQSQAGYRLARSVLAMGGGPKASASYRLRGTSGQTTGVGWLRSAGYQVHSGYWSPVRGSLLPLAAPSDLVAIPVSQTQIDLGWQDHAADETAYAVERSAEGSAGWGVAGTVGADATRYGDGGLACGTAYAYRVRAYRAGDGAYSTYSNVAGATTAPCGGGFRLYLAVVLQGSAGP